MLPGQPPCPTFNDDCLARGLLQDNGEWRLCLKEASFTHTATKLHYLFACLLIFGEPSQPDVLWHEFKPHICDDLTHHLRGIGIHDPSSDTIYDYGLFLFNKILLETGHSLDKFPSMPKCVRNWRVMSTNPLILEQLDYSQDSLQAILDEHLPNLNVDQ